MGIVNFQKQKSATFALTKAAYSKFQWTLFFQKLLQSVLQDQYYDDDKNCGPAGFSDHFENWVDHNFSLMPLFGRKVAL